jgi:hypothetical protein
MKTGKDFWLFFGGIVIGAIIGFYCFIFLYVFFASGKPKPSPPKIAGVKVPSETYEIDFSKRYNLILDSRYGSATYTYNDCLIKGFTRGKTESESSSRYEYFDTWLAVELSDGRMVYIPPRNIIMIEESRP